MKPILFSTDMVRAILENRKTQTRRVAGAPESACFKQGGLIWYDPMQNQETKRCPRYQIGDILWVRETWLPWDNLSWDLQQYFEGNGKKAPYIYRAEVDPQKQTCGWRPSIFMPREAARIFLRVTDVRAERLQDITEADAKTEGVITNDAVKVSSYVYWFEQLWDSLNAKRGYGWDINPWVWVYEFERISKEEL